MRHLLHLDTISTPSCLTLCDYPLPLQEWDDLSKKIDCGSARFNTEVMFTASDNVKSLFPFIFLLIELAEMPILSANCA